MRYRRRGKAYTHAHPSLDDEVRANMKEALGGRSLAWARRNKEAAFDMLERYQFSKGQAEWNGGSGEWKENGERDIKDCNCQITL